MMSGAMAGLAVLEEGKKRKAEEMTSDPGGTDLACFIDFRVENPG